MKPPQASFGPLLGFELRRLWRSPLPWLFAVATPALFLFVGKWQAPALERHLELHMYLAILGTVLSAFAAWASQRDRRAGTDEVFLAWPVESWRLALARTLALGTLTLALWLEVLPPSLAYTIVSHASAARAAAVAFPLGDALGDGALIALSLGASFLGAQALGQAAATLWPGLGGLVALVLFRMFALVGPRVVKGTLQWPFALLASPEFLWNGTFLSQGLETNLYTDIFAAHQGFWVAGSLGVLAALAFRFRARRDVPRIRSAAAAGLALAVVCGAAVPFVVAEQRRVASFARAIAAYGEPVKPRYQPAPVYDSEERFWLRAAEALPVPLSYNLNVDLRGAPRAVVEATLVLAAAPGAPTDTAAFTLRRVFTLDQVLVQGTPVPAANLERTGDLVRISTRSPLEAGQPFTVTFRYHGRVEDWRLDSYEVPAALASHDLVLMPAGWGWYPVPGQQRLTWEIPLTSMVFRALADRTQPFNDAEPPFDVAVQTPAGIRCLVGFEPGEAVREGRIWRLRGQANQVTLLGGDWWLREEGDVRYAIPFEELDTWQAASVDAHRLLSAAADWTGVAPVTVAPVPVPLTSLGDVTLVDARLLGWVYQPGPSRELLVSGVRRWLENLLRFQPRYGVPGQAAPVKGLGAVSSYVVDRVLADGLGAEAPGTPAGWAPEDEEALVERWAARTSVAAQKEQLHRLYRVARLRPLTPADLAFLSEEAE